MVLHHISLGLEMVAAFLTVLFIGRLLMERLLSSESGKLCRMSKRSLLRQQISRRAACGCAGRSFAAA